MRILLATALLALAAPAWAQDAEPAYDAGLVTACLSETESGSDVCVGRGSTACMAAPGGDTTVGMGSCIAAETKQWDDLLNEAYADLTAGGGERAEALKSAQRAWIDFVDAACDYEAAAYDGGTMAGTAGGSCRMRQTARRAVDLRGYLLQDAAR